MNSGWRGHANFQPWAPQKQPMQPKKTPPKRKVIHIMSTALWCDSGEHAFSSKDTNAQKFTKESQSEDRWGEPITKREDFNICGPCARKTGLFQNDTKAKNGESLPKAEGGK